MYCVILNHHTTGFIILIDFSKNASFPFLNIFKAGMKYAHILLHTLCLLTWGGGALFLLVFYYAGISYTFLLSFRLCLLWLSCHDSGEYSPPFDTVQNEGDAYGIIELHIFEFAHYLILIYYKFERFLSSSKRNFWYLHIYSFECKPGYFRW